MPSAAVRFSGKRLTTLRLEAGLSQSQLARKAGFGEMLVSRWERGKHSPSATNVGLLAHALGCSVADFYVNGEESEPGTSGDDDEEDDRALREIAAELIARQQDDLASALLARVQRMHARRRLEQVAP